MAARLTYSRRASTGAVNLDRSPRAWGPQPPGGPAARHAAPRRPGARTAYADTVDVAGVAFRVVCRYPKPRFWARSRPEFITSRRPEVTVAITYDEHFRRRARQPAREETVDDTPRVRRRGRRLHVTTGYYRATVDVGRGRAAVRMAGGFGVANLMRTLSALWLLEHGTLLLRALRLGNGSAPVLLVSPAAEAVCAAGRRGAGAPPAEAQLKIDGAGAPSTHAAAYVAVRPTADGLTAQPTPFVAEGQRLPLPRRPRPVALWISCRGGGPARSSGAAQALATLLPAVWQADRRRAALARTLELAARIVTTPACRIVDAGSPRREGSLVG